MRRTGVMSRRCSCLAPHNGNQKPNLLHCYLAGALSLDRSSVPFDIGPKDQLSRTNAAQGHAAIGQMQVDKVHIITTQNLNSRYSNPPCLYRL